MEKAVAFRTIMNEPCRDHPDEDSLERFLLHQCQEDELELVETHIIACEACVTRLETLEFNIEATKLALKSFVQSVRLAEPKPKGSFLSWLTLPRLSFAGASLAFGTLALTFISLPRDVNLTAYRGAESNYVSQWLPLDLHLNGRDLPSGPLNLEVVDARGEKMWAGSTSVKNDQIHVQIPRFTAAGQYFIRIYSTQEDASGGLLREFSIQTKPLF
jgi:hypothetical protein